MLRIKPATLQENPLPAPLFFLPCQLLVQRPQFLRQQCYAVGTFAGLSLQGPHSAVHLLHHLVHPLKLFLCPLQQPPILHILQLLVLEQSGEVLQVRMQILNFDVLVCAHGLECKLLSQPTTCSRGCGQLLHKISKTRGSNLLRELLAQACYAQHIVCRVCLLVLRRHT